MSNDVAVQTWKEGCGVGEDDTDIIILIIVELIVIIFILCLVIPLGAVLTNLICVSIRTT